MPFRDLVTVVTGASQGIGRVLAYRLADQHAKIVLAARNPDALDDVVNECRRRGGAAIAVPTDVTNRGACASLIDTAVREFGALDVLINNAGVSVVARFADLEDLDLPRRVMDVNYLGSVYCTYYALPHLRRSRGRIVAVSSLSGRTGVPLRSIYVASKHALNGFFDTLRIEEREHGVSVTIALPDFVQTEVKERVLGPKGERLAIHPGRRRFMTAERCADIILHAAAGRKREVAMSLRGKVGAWIKLLAPGVVDRIAARAMAQVGYR